MQAVASTSASAGRLPPPSPTLEPPPHQTLASSSTSTSTDLSQFLAPSFDASAYVASLINSVDSSLQSQNAAPQPPSPSGQHLQLPPLTTPPTGRKPSISLSPLSPSTPADAMSRKREQNQEDIDLSLAISRLNLAIEELDRSISTQVTSHAPALLSRTSALSTMQSGVAAARDEIGALDAEVANLRGKIHDPFVRAQELQGRMKLYDSAGELVGRSGKVVGLARRLEVQMEVLFSNKKDAGAEGEGEDAVVGQVHGRDLSRAALLISELTNLLNSPQEGPNGTSLLDLKLVQDLLPAIESAKKTVVDYMEDMIVRGLRDLSPLMLGSSLQTAFNLNTLPTLVQDLLNDLTEVVKERTAAAFNLDTLSRQLNIPIPTLDSPSSTNYSAYRRKGTSDAAAAALDKQKQIWSEAIWKRLESLLVVEMGAVCSKVYLLEKVLKLKTSDGGVNFLAAALEVLGDKPSTTFWLTLSQSLQQQVAVATGKSVWLGQLLSTGSSASGEGGKEGYVRLLRVVQEFFGKIGVYTDVQYSAAHQSAETVILVKSLGGLEKAYLDRATARVGEVLSQVTARRGGVGGEEEAESVVRMLANLLDTTRFDPLLSRAAVERCTALVDQFAGRLNSVVAKDSSVGNEGGAQSYNASLVCFSHSLAIGLHSVAAEQDSSTPTNSATAAAVTGSTTFASTRLLTSSDLLTSTFRSSIISPLLTQTKTTISTALAKMHAQLSSHSISKFSPEKGRVSIDSSSGASSYATEVCDLLWNLRDRILPLYPPPIAINIARTVARATVESFLLHAALLALPEGEGEADRVKLRLATDMTELEFAVTQIIGDLPSVASKGVGGGVMGEEASLIGGADAKRLSGAMKAFRRVLFQTVDEMEKDLNGEEKIAGELPRVILVLHLLSRSGAGVVERLIGNIVSSKGGAKGVAVRSEFVQWVLQQVSSDGGREESLLERIQKSLPGDLGLQTAELIQPLLKS